MNLNIISAMKKYFLLISVLFAFLCVSGCDHSNFEEDPNSFAPQHPIMKEFRFYPSVDHWSLRVLLGDSSHNGILIVNSSTTSIQNPYIYYKRTSNNTAYLSCNFQAMNLIGGALYGTYYEYEYHLTFTSAHQGIYTGRSIVNFSEEKVIEGYFVYDSETGPTPGQDEDSDDEEITPEEPEENPGDDNTTEPQDRFFVKISSASPSRVYFHVEYKYPNEYTDPDDYLSAGICYGTSPNPTVFDMTSQIQVVRPNNNSYSASDPLSSNTTYYFRPYREINGSIVYYEETSVKTPGTTENSDMMLKLTYVPDNRIKVEYKINTDGQYKVDLYTWDLQGTYSTHDFGYETKGDSGNYLYTWSLPWSSTRYFYLLARDIETDVRYESMSLYKSN